MRLRNRRWIRAEVKKGRFKGNHIDIDIGSHDFNTKIKMNGKELKRVQAVHIHIRVGDVPRVNIEMVD